MDDELKERMEADLEAKGMDLDSKEASRDCSCGELTDHLFEYLDAEASEEEQVRWEAHIASCPDCRDRADAERHVRSVLKRSCAEVAPSTLRERITRQIEAFRTTTGTVA